MAIWLLFIANSVLSKLPDPDFDAYYKADTVDAFLSSIKAEYPSVVTLSENGDYKHITLNYNAYPEHKLPTTVFVGSMYGGFPFTTYAVLYYLDKFVNEYYKNEDIQYIANTTRLIFIPIANYEAYRKTEELYSTNNTFIAIWTGLEGNDWNCTDNLYAGINPDSNFPFNFVKGDNKCAQNGYSGDSSLESDITSHLYNVTTNFSPNVIFNFYTDGGYIYYPPATYSSNKLTDDQIEYYNYVEKKNVDKMEYSQYSNYSYKSGSFIDFANNKSSLIFEVGPKTIDEATKDTVSGAAEEYMDFIVLGIQYHNVKIDKDDLYKTVERCKENCEGYEKNITFKFSIESEHYAPYYCDIVINPNFESKNITFSALKATELTIYDNEKKSSERTLSECNVTANEVKCTSVKIPGFKALSIEVTYKVPEKTEDDCEFISTITASKGYYPFESISYSSEDLEENDDEEDDDHNGGNRRRGVMTGLVLLIVLLILLLIAGIILCCAQRNKTPDEPGQFENANVV